MWETTVERFEERECGLREGVNERDRKRRNRERILREKEKFWERYLKKLWEREIEEGMCGIEDYIYMYFLYMFRTYQLARTWKLDIENRFHYTLAFR